MVCNTMLSAQLRFMIPDNIQRHCFVKLLQVHISYPGTHSAIIHRYTCNHVVDGKFISLILYSLQPGGTPQYDKNSFYSTPDRDVEFLFYCLVPGILINDIYMQLFMKIVKRPKGVLDPELLRLISMKFNGRVPQYHTNIIHTYTGESNQAYRRLVIMQGITRNLSLEVVVQELIDFHDQSTVHNFHILMTYGP